MTYMLPPLNALRAFEAAARHLSFKLAAHELHVTPGAVSQQVKGLEDRLGVRLFDRLHKQLVLTAPGLDYLAAVREAFGRIAAATAALRPAGAGATIHVGVRVGYDIAGLRARLEAFGTAHPRIGVRVSQPAGLRELTEGKVDALLDRSAGHHPGYRCDRLGGPGSNGGGDYLISPQGSADCPEVELLRDWLLTLPSASASPPVEDTPPLPPRSARRESARRRPGR